MRGVNHYGHLTSNTFGIDTIDFHTFDYGIQNARIWNVRKMEGPQKQPQVLTYQENSRPIYADSMYLNTPLARLDINKYGLKIGINKSNKAGLLDGQKVSDLLVEFEKYAARERIALWSRDSLKIARLDIAKDAIMTFEPKKYKELFKWSKGRRCEYPDGYLLGTKKEQVCFYDRGKKNQKDGLALIDNLMRAEARMRSREVIFQRTGISSLYDLKNANRRDLKKGYQEVLQSRFFSQFNPPREVLDFAGMFIRAKEFWGKGWLYKCLAANNIAQLQSVGEDVVKMALMAVEENDRTIRRQMSGIRKIIAFAHSTVKKIDNYHGPTICELRERFLRDP